jgi:hypothetical protein
MENGDKTAESLELAAVKEGYNTHAAVDIDWRVSQIDWLSRWKVVYHYLVILNCRHGNIARKIGHPVESYSLPLVEIPSSTWSENNDGGKPELMHDVMSNESEYC